MSDNNGATKTEAPAEVATPVDAEKVGPASYISLSSHTVLTPQFARPTLPTGDIFGSLELINVRSRPHVVL